MAAASHGAPALASQLQDTGSASGDESFLEALHVPPLILGVAVLVVALCVAALCCYCRRRRGRRLSQPYLRTKPARAPPAAAAAPPPPPPLPAGLVLQASVPKVVSQTYLCFSVAGGSAASPEAVRWTVQKRCSQFEDLAFFGPLQQHTESNASLAALSWPPKSQSEDPRKMETRRAYADSWAQQLGAPGGPAWDTTAFRDFVRSAPGQAGEVSLTLRLCCFCAGGAGRAHPPA